MEFVTLYRPHQIERLIPSQASLERISGGYALNVKLSDGEFTVLLPTEDDVTLQAHGLNSKGTIKGRLKRAGSPTETVGLSD